MGLCAGCGTDIRWQRTHALWRRCVGGTCARRHEAASSSCWQRREATRYVAITSLSYLLTCFRNSPHSCRLLTLPCLTLKRPPTHTCTCMRMLMAGPFVRAASRDPATTYCDRPCSLCSILKYPYVSTGVMAGPSVRAASRVPASAAGRDGGHTLVSPTTPGKGLGWALCRLGDRDAALPPAVLPAPPSEQHRCHCSDPGSRGKRVGRG